MTHRPLTSGFALLILAGAALWFASSASATTLVKLTLDDLITHSEHVARGEVVSMTSAREGGRIVTNVEVRLEESMKGELAGESFTVRVLGGRHQDLVTIVHGSPDFSRGEHVLLFMQRLGPKAPGAGALVVTGMAQGKFTVTRGPDQETLYVVPDLGDTPLMERVEVRDEQGQIQRRLRQATPAALHQRVSSLETVRARVRELDKAVAP